MLAGLRRHYGNNDLHFITFSCYQRRPLLSTAAARDLFVQELARVRAEYTFKLVGYVVMLNHVHLLISEPVKGTPSTVMQMMKQRVSRKMRSSSKTPASAVSAPFSVSAPSSVFEGGSRPQLPFRLNEGGQEGKAFWQERFYDFNVYRSGKVKEKLNYMHANPVIRRLVQRPEDWPWSSWSFYF
jgi:REP-associated tyrosine transposase